METIKNSFAKGLTALNVKTNNFMEENKSKTYITTLTNEIKELKLALGEAVYENYEKDEDITSITTELMEKIKEKYAGIAEQEEKIRQLQREEEQILGKTMSNPEEIKADYIFCSQCGTRNVANYKFCCKCGVPLK